MTNDIHSDFSTFPEWELADRQVALVIAASVKVAMAVPTCLEVVYLILAECDVNQGPVQGHVEKERYVSVMRDTPGHADRTHIYICKTCGKDLKNKI